MSDFDMVLERLLADEEFQLALAADPAAALAGYELTAQESTLLNAQVTTDAGPGSQVEQRTSKAGLAGLLGPLAGLVGLGHGGATGATTHTGFGATSQAGFGASGQSGFGQPSGQAGFGDSGQAGFGSTIGTSPGEVEGGAGVTHGTGAGAGSSPDGAYPAGDDNVGGYHTRVDADGDGHWDEHRIRQSADGGVDVLVDIDHDGRIDFVGHDADRDGLIDSADSDSDRDGTLETHLRDTNRDGWMDTRVVEPAPASAESAER